MKSSNNSSYQYKLADLVIGLDVIVQGDPHCLITGVSPIQQATPGHITFLTNSLYRKYLATTEASAVILQEADAVNCSVNAVVSRNPYYTYAKIAEFFQDPVVMAAGIHPTAVVGHHCQIDPTAVIGA